MFFAGARHISWQCEELYKKSRKEAPNRIDVGKPPGTFEQWVNPVGSEERQKQALKALLDRHRHFGR